MRFSEQTDWARDVLAAYRVDSREPSVLALADLEADLLRLLVDDPQLGFAFARYKDEVLDVSLGDATWECVGATPLGLLLVDDAGAVWLCVTAGDGFESAGPGDLVPANSDLQAFVDCYAAFQRAAWRLRTSESQLSQLEGFERRAERWISRIDPTAYAAADALWPALVYAVGDDLIAPVYTAHALAAEGRFRFGNVEDAERPTPQQRRRTDRRSRP